MNQLFTTRQLKAMLTTQPLLFRIPDFTGNGELTHVIMLPPGFETVTRGDTRPNRSCEYLLGWENEEGFVEYISCLVDPETYSESEGKQAPADKIWQWRMNHGDWQPDLLLDWGYLIHPDCNSVGDIEDPGVNIITNHFVSTIPLDMLKHQLKALGRRSPFAQVLPYVDMKKTPKPPKHDTSRKERKEQRRLDKAARVAPQVADIFLSHGDRRTRRGTKARYQPSSPYQRTQIIELVERKREVRPTCSKKNSRVVTIKLYEDKVRTIRNLVPVYEYVANPFTSKAHPEWNDTAETTTRFKRRVISWDSEEVVISDNQPQFKTIQVFRFPSNKIAALKLAKEPVATQKSNLVRRAKYSEISRMFGIARDKDIIDAYIAEHYAPTKVIFCKQSSERNRFASIPRKQLLKITVE